MKILRLTRRKQKKLILSFKKIILSFEESSSYRTKKAHRVIVSWVGRKSIVLQSRTKMIERPTEAYRRKNSSWSSQRLAKACWVVYRGQRSFSPARGELRVTIERVVGRIFTKHAARTSISYQQDQGVKARLVGSGRRRGSSAPGWVIRTEGTRRLGFPRGTSTAPDPPKPSRERVGVRYASSRKLDFFTQAPTAVLLYTYFYHVYNSHTYPILPSLHAWNNEAVVHEASKRACKLP